MTSQRTERVGEIIKEETSGIIKTELKDPRIGFVTVTGVDVSPDLRHASVYVSVMGSEQEKEQTLEALRKAKGFVRTELGKRIRLKYFPELAFEIDRSVEKGVKINKILRKLKEEESDG